MRLTRGTEEKLKFLLRNQNRVHSDQMKAAIECYERRLRLKEEPEGDYRIGIWIPSLREHRYCCNRYLRRGIKYNNELKRHCKTHVHVAFLHGVSSAQLLFEINQMAEREQLRSLIEEFKGEDNDNT